jgi:hypothetical protein
MEINFKIYRDEGNWKITFDKDSWGILNWSRRYQAASF